MSPGKNPIWSALAVFLVLCGAWLLVFGGSWSNRGLPDTPEERLARELELATEQLTLAEEAFEDQNFGAVGEANERARAHLIAAQAHLKDAR